MLRCVQRSMARKYYNAPKEEFTYLDKKLLGLRGKLNQTNLTQYAVGQKVKMIRESMDVPDIKNTIKANKK